MHALPLPPKPIIQLSSQSIIQIIGQAPGLKTHHASLPFLDASGDRLRKWLHIPKQLFYNAEVFAVTPMSFCYPGKSSTGSGDAPPIKQCFEQWHGKIANSLQHVKLRILIGNYAAKAYLPKYDNLEEAIKLGEVSETIVLPHPSPRNNIWLKKHSWFEQKTLPIIRQRLWHLIQNNTEFTYDISDLDL